jgi:hypothetical protein
MDPAYAKVIGIVLLTGFAIQQALQIIDLPISALLRRYSLTGAIGMSYSDFKKVIMTVIALAIAGVTVWLCGLHTLWYIDQTLFEKHPCFDRIVTALVLSAGTEGVNTLIKYFGYVKDARRQAIIGVEQRVVGVE